MSIVICTDSSSLLSPATAESLEIDVVPIAVALNGEPFDEGAEPIDDFYARLRAGAVATTSQPSPADFAAAYDRAASRGARNVVSIHLDARASGTVASAEIAARDASVPVTVVDTGAVSFGVGVCVRTAAEAAAAGRPAQEAAGAASLLGASMKNVFAARGGPGGRVPSAKAWTLFRFTGGVTSTISECTSVAAMVGEIASYATRGERRISAAVGHAGQEMESAADELAQRLLSAEVVVAVERYRVGASVGAHTGPESFGVFWWPTP